ncbi:hypothetical protein PILCRDRAFT_817728 [Piloderma croceum F 1598]|uniref:Uncharacterized protein n=1 Tax=Piloderma croceum (strain F 1598) TaxID=765440 RepID=A0A0C3G2M7_PILCF|nr:hypothetical protein PILCRDRAFT_817728 [Piloderma croceum F 1598]
MNNYDWPRIRTCLTERRTTCPSVLAFGWQRVMGDETLSVVSGPWGLEVGIGAHVPFLNTRRYTNWVAFATV